MIINPLRLSVSYWTNREHMNCHQARNSHMVESEPPFSNGFVMKGGNSACISYNPIGQILAILESSSNRVHITIGLWDITLIGIPIYNEGKEGRL